MSEGSRSRSGAHETFEMRAKGTVSTGMLPKNITTTITTTTITISACPEPSPPLPKNCEMTCIWPASQPPVARRTGYYTISPDITSLWGSSCRTAGRARPTRRRPLGRQCDAGPWKRSQPWVEEGCIVCVGCNMHTTEGKVRLEYQSVQGSSESQCGCTAVG